MAPETLQDGRADVLRSFHGSETKGAEQGRSGRDFRLWSLEQMLSCLNPQPLGVCAFQDDFPSPGFASVPEDTYSPNQSRPLCPWELSSNSAVGILIPQLSQPLSGIILGHEFCLQGIKPRP